MKQPERYMIEIRITDQHTGKNIYHFKPAPGNLMTGLLGAKGFIEHKLGIPAWQWKDEDIRKKVNTVLQLGGKEKEIQHVWEEGAGHTGLLDSTRLY